jgi:hypothetical protein
VHSILEPASHDQASRDRDDIMEQLANMWSNHLGDFVAQTA